MTNIAFVGLGIMGAPMATHLAKAGHRVRGVDHTPAKGETLVAAGGSVTESVAAATRDADVVALMVQDSPQVNDILAGPDGVFENARPGTLIVDFSTIRPDITVQLAHQAADRGLRMVDAPVSGGQQGAIDATLSIMVGGTIEDFEYAKPLLEIVGKTIVHVGPNGAGQTVKAANQLMVAAHIEALAEAIVFLQAHGVDLEAALKVLGGGMAGSKVLDMKGPNMIAHSFDPGFRIDLHHKDLGIVTSTAREAGLVLPIGGLVAQLMASARANGDGGLDHSALLKGVQRLSGLSSD